MGRRYRHINPDILNIRRLGFIVVEISQIANPPDRWRASRKLQMSKGFTLLEILIAVFILGIVMSTLLGAFNTLFSTAIQISEAESRNFETANTCLSRMRVDLKSIYVSPYPEYRVPDLDSEPDPYRIVGDVTDEGGRSFGRLRFTSLAHCPFRNQPIKGIAEIVYYVQADSDGKYVLKRSDRLEPYSDFEPQLSDSTLFKGIDDLTFTFYDDQGEVYEQWNSDDPEFDYSTPRAIDIRLGLNGQNPGSILQSKVILPLYRDKKE